MGKDKDRGGWDLDNFSQALIRSSDHREAVRLQWQEALGEPKIFLPDTDPELAAKGFGVGFFRTDWSVFAVRKYSNGYDPDSRIDYAYMLIDVLNKVRGE